MMSAREQILSTIKNNKPSLAELPLISLQEVTQYEDVVTKFKTMIESIGGEVVELEDVSQLDLLISEEMNKGNFVLNAMHGSGDIDNKNAVSLEPVHKAFIKAGIGVAENGAVWVKESQMINRLLPFICQHLVVVLEKDNIVSTMHHAYQQINTFEEGFGVFIAGPSKTADIEQSLVIGAHGARSMTVLVLS